MTSHFTLTIAGTALTVSSADERITVFPPTPLPYREFIELEPARNAEIEVVVSTEPVPSFLLNDRRRIFDGGGVWSLYRGSSCGDNDSILTYNPFADRPPLWTIHSDHYFSRLTAYCHQYLIEEADGGKTLPSPIFYPIDQVVLLHHFARKEGLIVHATGLEHGESSSIFPGRSGAGKSSLAKLLLQAEGGELLSDDRVVIRKESGIFISHGTPWPGEAQIAANRKSPLKNLVFLAHASKNRITTLAPDQALARLFPVASIPWYDEECIGDVLDFCGDLVKTIPAFELQFTLDSSVLDVLSDVY